MNVTNEGAFCAEVQSTPTPADLAVFHQMYSEHANAVREALWRIIGPCDDLGGDLNTVRELEQDVWVRVFLSLPNWTRPGYSLTADRPPAKKSTRLFEFAKFQALAWRKTRIRELEKLGLRRPKAPEFETGPLPFDYAARFLCAHCGALQPLAAGFVVADGTDPNLTLRCGHTRRLSGSRECDRIAA